MASLYRAGARGENAQWRFVFDEVFDLDVNGPWDAAEQLIEEYPELRDHVDPGWIERFSKET